MALAISSSSSSFFSSPKKRSSSRFSKTTKSSSKSPTFLTITASSSSSSLPPMKIVRCPALDRRAAKHSHLRFARKLKTLLLSKPKQFLPLRVLSRCRAYLNPPPSRSLLSMIQRYPSLFTLFHVPSHNSPSSSLLAVTLTPAAASLAAEEFRLRACLTDALADKLHRLLMLAPHRRLLLSKLAHLAPDLGLAPDFRSRLCNAHPSRFRTIDTSYGRALELVSWDQSLAVALPRLDLTSDVDPLRRPIIERVPRFPQLRLRRGLNLRRRHREYLIRFQDLPEVNPYESLKGDSTELEEKMACAVVREVVGMTTERRTLVDHLTHFRKDLRLPNRLRAMLVRHPEMFYVSVKGTRDSVFLVEAYDEKGRLVVEDELRSVKERLAELVMEGKRMRRERRRGVFEEEDDEVEAEKEEDDDDEGLEDLFESGIGEDWEELQEEWGIGDEKMMETDELWARGTNVLPGGGEVGRKLEVW
ncbi:protein ROOT PRIMORDIUM DEFECTIVE 1 [Phalaenopsis equestris]|uniref:protein ROOT PRIMORDIUM DEFECTIVE 1 n=1 Tax=Phalaenopsis equestris TaxID=78828 RepID=UPI0009E64771|nr:protein ROOT PRIMORDIUM DEFECTIVE 1 [Phalaenopsis equestris]